MEHRTSLWVVVALAVLAATAAVRAQGLIEFTGAGDGTSWGSTANWETLPSPDPSVDPSSRFKDPLDPSMLGTARLPLSTETAFLRNAVTATLSSGTTVLNGLYIGGREYRLPTVQSGTVQARSTSTMVMTGGSLCITYGSLWTSPGGTLRAANGTFTIGDYYDGRFIQLGGTVSTDYLEIAVKDPSGNMSVRPTGYYRLADGLITNSGTTTLRIRVGAAGPNNMPGGEATLVLDGGAILPTQSTASGQKRPYIDVAHGTFGSTYRPRGTVIMTGGSFETENWSIGLTKGDGLMTVSGGYIYNTDAITAGYGAESSGTFTQTGGTIRTSSLKAGFGSTQGEANGVINLNGGVMNIVSGIPLGQGMANAGGTAYVGYGQLNIRQTDPNVPTVVQFTGSTGSIILGQGNNKADPGFGPAPGIGEINVLGGSFAIQNSVVDVILGGPAANNRPGTQSRGTLNVLGGSFVTNGRILFTPAYTTDLHGVHGVMRVGRNAYCYVGDQLSMNGGTTAPSPYGNTSKLILEVSSTTSSMIYLNAVPWLSDTLRVEGASGWRPREGNKFAVMHSYFNPYDNIWYRGSFSTYETNLAGGQQLSDPNDPNSPLLPFWTSLVDPNEPRDYLAVFQGLTSGDANGDHAVNGGDLALIGGSWAQSGKSWGQGNFNGDPNGLVDGGDLALLGGNWLWTLPAAPEPAPLPEPATLALLSLGAAGLIRRRRA